MSRQTCTPRPLYPQPPPARLRCGTCGLESGAMVAPLHLRNTRKPVVGITLRRVSERGVRPAVYRCQFCWAPVEDGP